MSAKERMNHEHLARIQEMTIGILQKVTPEHLGDPTPCAEWDVAALIDHMVGAHHWARSAMEGVEQTETGEGSAQGDFVTAYREAGAASVAAFAEEGAMGRTVDMGMGPMPAGSLLGLALTDTFVHAWDLATAIGEDNDLDREIAERILVTARAHTPDAMRSEDGAMFGFEQPAPADAPPATKLAAFLGRKV